MYEPVHLLMITTNNNNKYYDMTKINDSEWEARYGRVGASPQIRHYHLSQWEKKYREKIAKGYKDMSDMIEEAIEKEKPSGPKEYEDIKNKAIADIVENLQNLAKKTISENYKVNASVVTQKMVDSAQTVLDSLVNFDGTVDEFNTKLLELFTIIPRKMSNVNEYLVTKKSDFNDKITRESDILNTMRSQVYIKEITEETEKSTQILNKGTILDALGLEIEEVSNDEINMIKNLMNESKDKFKKAWRVTNKKTQKRFDDFVKKEKIKDTRLLFHGSRSENFWSIIQTGLVLRPTNAVITGKMFGYGIYYSPHCQKSIGYTSLNGSYWAKGNNNTAYMALFDVAYGIPYDVYSFDSKYYGLNYDELQSYKKGANCLHAHKDQGMLRNDEIVVYKEEQMTIKYLIEIGY